MATQGIVSVISRKKVLMKVVAGCDGYNANLLAKKLLEQWPVEPEKAYELAKEVRFGCDACRFVITKDKILGLNEVNHELENFEGDEDFDTSGHNLYREKFKDPMFNPRWKYGTASHFQIVDVATK